MDKIITITVSLAKPSETAEKELIEKAQEIAEELITIYGGKVSIEWTAKRT